MLNTIKQVFNSYRNGNEKTQLIYETLFLFLTVDCVLFLACLIALIKSY